MFLRRSKSQRHRERGYVLLVIMMAATLLIIALAMAIPEVAHNLKRDREEEMIHRGAQYARAIRRFYQKNSTYPATLDQLLQSNKVRYLRQKYKDPMTGKDFKLCKYGDPCSQMLGSGGLSPSGASGNPGGTNSNQGATTNNLMTAPGPDVGGGKFAGQGSGVGVPSPATSPSNPSGIVQTTDTSGQPQGSPSQQTGLSPQQSTGGLLQQPAATSTTQQTGQSTSDQSGSNGQPQSLAGAGSAAPTFGGGAIVGVTSTSENDSIRVFNKKHRYNEWQFFYDRKQDLTITTGQGGLPQIVLIKGPYNGPPNNVGPGTPIGTTPGPNSSTTGGSPFQQ